MGETFFSVWRVNEHRWTAGDYPNLGCQDRTKHHKLTQIQAQDWANRLNGDYGDTTYAARAIGDPETVLVPIIKPIPAPLPKHLFPNFYTDGHLDVDMLESYMIGKGFTYLGKGRHRRTFLSKNKRFVIKFPRSLSGSSENKSERKHWVKVFGKGDPDNANCRYAPCRMIDGHILMMRAMVEIYGGTEADKRARDELKLFKGGNAFSSGKVAEVLPNWYKECRQDAGQIGKMSNGDFVLYDYA